MKLPDEANNRFIFREQYKNYLIVVAEIYRCSDIPFCFWYICDQRENILSDNTKSGGEDSVLYAIAEAKHIINEFYETK